MTADLHPRHCKTHALNTLHRICLLWIDGELYAFVAQTLKHRDGSDSAIEMCCLDGTRLSRGSTTRGGLRADVNRP